MNTVKVYWNSLVKETEKPYEQLLEQSLRFFSQLRSKLKSILSFDAFYMTQSPKEMIINNKSLFSYLRNINDDDLRIIAKLCYDKNPVIEMYPEIHEKLISKKFSYQGIDCSCTEISLICTLETGTLFTISDERIFNVDVLDVYVDEILYSVKNLYGSDDNNRNYLLNVLEEYNISYTDRLERLFSTNDGFNEKYSSMDKERQEKIFEKLNEIHKSNYKENDSLFKKEQGSIYAVKLHQPITRVYCYYKHGQMLKLLDLLKNHNDKEISHMINKLSKIYN